MSPATDSKGVVFYAYPYIAGAETQWLGLETHHGKPSPRSPPRIANLDLPAQHIGYLADETVRHNVDALSFDFDRDPSHVISIAANVRCDQL